MSNQTNKKAPFNRGDKKLVQELRSIWLGMRDSNSEFTMNNSEDNVRIYL